MSRFPPWGSSLPTKIHLSPSMTNLGGRKVKAQGATLTNGHRNQERNYSTSMLRVRRARWQPQQWPAQWHSMFFLLSLFNLLVPTQLLFTGITSKSNYLHKTLVSERTRAVTVTLSLLWSPYVPIHAYMLCICETMQNLVSPSCFLQVRKFQSSYYPTASLAWLF